MGDESTGLREEGGDAGFHVAGDTVVDSFPGSLDYGVDVLGVGCYLPFFSSIGCVGVAFDE